MRVPGAIATQVEALCSRYQNFLSDGGDPANPRLFLEKTYEPPVAVKPCKHQPMWEELNSRQRTYLSLIFEIDQQRQEFERGNWHGG
ncbi:MAG TPA: hypothetical protein V6D37_16235 [Candidatus Sericytochromatia bacterium]|jgi:hypothetical protein